MHKIDKNYQRPNYVSSSIRAPVSVCLFKEEKIIRKFLNFNPPQKNSYANFSNIKANCWNSVEEFENKHRFKLNP